MLQDVPRGIYYGSCIIKGVFNNFSQTMSYWGAHLVAPSAGRFETINEPQV